MAPLIWLAAAGLLFLVEVSVPGFGGFAIAAVAALLLSALTAVVAAPPTAQILLFVLLSLVGGVAVWRWARRHRQQLERIAPVSDRAEVITGFDGRGQGRVRWQGQSWAAEMLEPGPPLQPGDPVVVMRRVGTHLEVVPAER